MAFPELIDDGRCFVCGCHNVHGMHLTFTQDGEDVVTEFTPTASWQGFQGIVHGGILSTVLDEVMAQVMLVRGKRGLTSKLEVEFKQMAHVGKRLTVRGRLIKERGRILIIHAEAYADNGEEVVTAQGKWVRFSARAARGTS